jgi:uncharacterized membrane protein YGL010W
MVIQLDATWSELMRRYELDHRDGRNQLCHAIGIPLIIASVPVAITGVGLPAGLLMFSVGWGFQFVGHVFEGKKPSFVDDRRNLLVGGLWWLKKTAPRLVKLADEGAQRDAP